MLKMKATSCCICTSIHGIFIPCQMPVDIEWHCQSDMQFPTINLSQFTGKYICPPTEDIIRQCWTQFFSIWYVRFLSRGTLFFTLFRPFMTIVFCSLTTLVLRLPILQPIWAQIRLLPLEQSDQGSKCLLSW